MSETRWARTVPANTVAGPLVKFQLSESMSFDPMSLHVHAAPSTLSVYDRRPTAPADMSETAARRTVVPLTLSERRAHLSFKVLELSIAASFHGGGEPS